MNNRLRKKEKAKERSKNRFAAVAVNLVYYACLIVHRETSKTAPKSFGCVNLHHYEPLVKYIIIFF